MKYSYLIPFLIVGLLVSFANCKQESDTLTGDPGDGGLTLPGGFEALVVAESIGPARHLAVRDNGDIYATVISSPGKKAIVALRDTTDDGKADIIRRFGAFDEKEFNN